MKKIILLALLLTLCSITSFAQQDDIERYRREQRESLRDLAALNVFISAPAELNVMKEETAVRARLEKSGVKVNTEAPATLLVSIYAHKDARRKVYAVFLSVEVLQPATINRTGKSENAMTWIRRMPMISDGRWKVMHETLAGMLDDFVSDYQLVNPRRRS